jgi:hypothetical protein
MYLSPGERGNVGYVNLYLFLPNQVNPARIVIMDAQRILVTFILTRYSGSIDLLPLYFL